MKSRGSTTSVDVHGYHSRRVSYAVRKFARLGGLGHLILDSCWVLNIGCRCAVVVGQGERSRLPKLSIE